MWSGAPGSRNAPLSLALQAADATGRLRLHVRIDERTAGFLALGLARGSGTGGGDHDLGYRGGQSAPRRAGGGHGQVPLMVLSADRPPWLRDVGANQTVDQHDIFGSALRFFHEFAVPQTRSGQQGHWRSMAGRAWSAAAGAGGGPPGPVQLNVPLAEPLMPDADPAWPEPLTGRDGPWTRTVALGPAPTLGPALGAVPAPERGERVLFVADLTHPWAAPIAEAGHLVVAEAGGAAGRHVLAAGVHLLSAADFLDHARPDRIVVLGRPTLFRPVQALLADPRIVVDVIANPGHYADPTGTARVVAPGRPDLRMLPDGEWAARWRDANAAAGKAVAEVLGGLDLSSSPRLARELVDQLPEQATLVLGSSQPPRDVALSTRGPGRCAGDRQPWRGRHRRHGLDRGRSRCSPRTAKAGPTVAHLGDLTLLHDLTGLVIGPDEPRARPDFVVSNNDGGGDLRHPRARRARHAGPFERVFGTPHGIALAQLADGLGVEHLLITTGDELADAIAEPAGLRIVEVPTSRTDLRELSERVRAVVAAAVG